MGNRKHSGKSPICKLKRNLLDLLSEHDVYVIPDDVPRKFEKHGDLALLPSNCFTHDVWEYLGPQLWDVVATALGCQRVAKKHRIVNDKFRSPTTELLKGADTWVIRVDNGIKMTFDVTKCMFSSGNISEKLRIAKFDCTGETVVDMYAGIGYFVLPYLVHAKASFVHACEWNPHAVEALKKNLELNCVSDRCSIHEGDNRQICPSEVADRINIGLIPSSQGGWITACKALKKTGGVFHVHAVVTSGLNDDRTRLKVETFGDLKEFLPENCTYRVEWRAYATEAAIAFRNILMHIHNCNWTSKVMHIEKVKSYAPHMDHLVIDIKCTPDVTG